MKAHFNNLLEQQKLKVQSLESQVSSAKLTYADALRNLEQISDEIHQTRNKNASNIKLEKNKQLSIESNESFVVDLDDEEYKRLPRNMSNVSITLYPTSENIDGYKNVIFGTNASPLSPLSQSEDCSDNVQRIVTNSHSSEWTEINLDVSSPEEEVPYNPIESDVDKPKLIKQRTLPNQVTDNEYTSITNKLKLDAGISNWITRSSLRKDNESTSKFLLNFSI